MTAKLTFPAPRRCSANCGERTERVSKKQSITIHEWADHPWTLEEVNEAKLAGMFFQRHRHDFADAEAEEAATGKKTRPSGDIRNWLKKLSPEQQEILREQLRKEVES